MSWLTNCLTAINPFKSNPERDPLNPPQKSSWCGRHVKVLAVRGLVLTVGLGSTIAVAYHAFDRYQRTGHDPSAATLEGVYIGIAAPLTFMGTVSRKTVDKVFNFISRWSFETFEGVTQFYENAGWPIDGEGLWSQDPEPGPIHEVFYITFPAMSACYITVMMRALVLQGHQKSKQQSIQLGGDGTSTASFSILKPKNKLLESSTDSWIQFFVEQGVKTGAGIALLSTYNTVHVLPLYYFGAFLVGNAAGASYQRVWTYAKTKIVATDWWEHQKRNGGCLMKSTLKVAELYERFEHVIGNLVVGGLFASDMVAGFGMTGFLMGAGKMKVQKRFEYLEENPYGGKRFKWLRKDNLVKGAGVAIIAFWYTYGMTDQNVTWGDRTAIILFLGNTMLSYGSTRYHATHFQPGKNSKVFNNSRFYFVDFPEYTAIPFMLVRATGNIGDTDLAHDGPIRVMAAYVAWWFFGGVAGGNRALQGLKRDEPLALPPAIMQMLAMNTIVSSYFGKF